MKTLEDLREYFEDPEYKKLLFKTFSSSLKEEDRVETIKMKTSDPPFALKQCLPLSEGNVRSRVEINYSKIGAAATGHKTGIPVFCRMPTFKDPNNDGWAFNNDTRMSKSTDNDIDSKYLHTNALQ
jgi:hypothetical protein